MDTKPASASDRPNVAPLSLTGNGKDRLRFVVCGLAGDGGSTLIGCLLAAKQVRESGLSAAETEGHASVVEEDAFDPILPIHEREVACRHFETDGREFVAIDVSGGERHARNVAAGALRADVALILVDARKGVLARTLQHSHVVSLMGVHRAILAVNKMDLVDYDEGAFSDIVEAYRSAAREIGFEEVRAAPISALTGDNVAVRGGMPWYGGPTLLEILETVESGCDRTTGAFRMPVRPANRPRSGSREVGGMVVSGFVERGMGIVASLSGGRSTVERIAGPSGDLDRAAPGQSVMLTLADDLDVGRGDMIADADAPPGVSDQFAVHLVWSDSRPMLPQRPYSIRLAGASGIARITDLIHRVDVDPRRNLAVKTLNFDEVGYCKISLDRAVPFDPYSENRQTGAFVLGDELTGAIVGVGVIEFALRRASNIAWHEMKVDKAARVRAIGQRPRVLWMTGLSGAGKSTIADRLEQKLQAMGRHTYLLDGDNVRHGLNKDLGFTDADRVENIRRIAEVGRLMVDAGLIVIVSFISPFRAEREMARALVEEGEFVEIHVDASLEVCEARDPKRLYAKARKGDLVNFTGIDSPYESPQNPELHIDTTKLSPDEAADKVIRFLRDGRPGAG